MLIPSSARSRACALTDDGPELAAEEQLRTRRSLMLLVGSAVLLTASRFQMLVLAMIGRTPLVDGGTLYKNLKAFGAYFVSMLIELLFSAFSTPLMMAFVNVRACLPLASLSRASLVPFRFS